ncbi:DUF1232 domain-containing protein [Spongiibacter sp. KMU-158]|uniref:DUF1232 domain-containing protein n=1 Tax=Spongiibacter pelagi TaxID=2760804 RepID=A0A927C4C7_9GAMM|nr:YkvA family protein [Spongiibacter pelagi]MBD2859210.1 DUF1232 domain-containing protein [Spongiibacter pelagi]
MALFSEKRAAKILEEGRTQSNEQTLETALSNRDKILRKVINSASLAPFLAQVSTLFSMIKDYVTGEYREVPWWSLGSATTALLYILMPLDALPDFIPIAGFLDDAVVLKLCLDLIGKDINEYRKLREQTQDQAE